MQCKQHLKQNLSFKYHLNCMFSIIITLLQFHFVSLFTWISEIVPALRYTLEWIYQFVVLQNENHFLFRQCASAVIALLASQNANHLFDERLALCFSKWFTIAAHHGNLEVRLISVIFCVILQSHVIDIVCFFFRFTYIVVVSSCFVGNMLECNKTNRTL